MSGPGDPAGSLDPPAIRTFAHFRVALRYHTLSFVPLPGDDADLHRRDYARAWRADLEKTGVTVADLDAGVAAAREALAAGPRRLAPQADVLVAPGTAPDDGPLGRLESLLAPSYEAVWEEALDATEACRRSFQAMLAAYRGLFAALRLAGIERLDVHVCPALHRAGRATRVGATYAVAVPLPDDEASREQAFLQLVHECCHPLVDDVVAPFLPAAGADTARDAPGHETHARREDAALVVGRHWLAGDEVASRAYLAWVARYRSPERLAERLAGALDLPEPAREPVLARACAVARGAGRLDRAAGRAPGFVARG